MANSNCSNCGKSLGTYEFNHSDKGIVCDSCNSGNPEENCETLKSEKSNNPALYLEKVRKESEARKGEFKIPSTLKEIELPKVAEPRFRSHYLLDSDTISSRPMITLSSLTLLFGLLGLIIPKESNDLFLPIAIFLCIITVVYSIYHVSYMDTRKKVMKGEYRILSGELTLRMLRRGDEKRSTAWLEEEDGSRFTFFPIIDYMDYNILDKQLLDCVLVEEQVGKYCLLHFTIVPQDTII